MRLTPIYLLLSLSPQIQLASCQAEEVHIVEQTIDVNAQDPLLYQSMSPPPDTTSASKEPEEPSARHVDELAALQNRLSKSTGTYNQYHPRHRLLDALWGYASYESLNLAEVNRWKGLYKSLSKKQKKTLDHSLTSSKSISGHMTYPQKLDKIATLIETVNTPLTDSIVASALSFYGISPAELDSHIKGAEKAGRKPDRISVSQTLKHYVRDWADEGSKERGDAFPCLVGVMRGLKWSMRGGDGDGDLKVLLPGAGLGRLGSEVNWLGGFEVTTNEWSTYMNVAYRFMTSPSPSTANVHTIHPFLDGLSHHATTSDALRAVAFPNVPPSQEVLLVEGDFTSAFNGEDKGGYYDIVVTHFFIDTARNLMSYFDTIKKVLRQGGKWVNLGPLLYGTGPFVQLSLDEILDVIEEMGFAFEDVQTTDADEKEEEHRPENEDGQTERAPADGICGRPTFEGKKVLSLEAEYGFNGRALTKNAYLAQVWVARKL